MGILKSNCHCGQRPATQFRQYMESKNHAKTTQKAYLKSVAVFLKWYKQDPVNCSKKDILNFLSYLKDNTKQQNISRRNICIALNHYFTALLQAGMVSHNPAAFIKIQGANRKRLYKIYTPDELAQLADNFYVVFITGFDDSHLDKSKKQVSFLSRHRNYAMLTFLLFQGLPTNELTQININNIDLKKARLTLKNRILPIQAAQMGTLIHYINNIRPLLIDICGETDKLFFSLSADQYDKTFSKPLRKLTKQVKSIDHNFVNFSQTRTSVITHWIQTEGLRKAQYLAGHKNITATENYLPNDLNSLINEIQKFNPF